MAKLDLVRARLNDVEATDRGMAMVFQNYALYPHMSVRENLSFSLRIQKTPRDEIRRVVGEDGRRLR